MYRYSAAGNSLAERMNKELLATPGTFRPEGVKMVCAPGKSCVRADSAVGLCTLNQIDP